MPVLAFIALNSPPLPHTHLFPNCGENTGADTYGVGIDNVSVQGSYKEIRTILAILNLGLWLANWSP